MKLRRSRRSVEFRRGERYDRRLGEVIDGSHVLESTDWCQKNASMLSKDLNGPFF